MDQSETMDDAQRLHCFVRRQCRARWRQWAEAYEPMARAAQHRVPYFYTNEEYATFPRYNLDQAVLEAVEAFDFDRLPDVETLRACLIEAASTAGEFSGNNPIEAQAVSEERDSLVKAIRDVDVSDLSDDRLPYQRVLGEAEKARVAERLAKTWGAPNAYWYPLGDKTHPSLIAFDLLEVEEAVLQARIMEFLSGRGVNRVLELREYGPSYELEPCAESFAYNGAEGFWTTASNDWVVYCSHESSMTVGGALAILFSGTEFARIDFSADSRWRY